MTHNEMTPAIGAKVLVRFESIHVACTVIDAKTAYGRPRLLIRPEAGEREQWIELNRLVPARGSTPGIART